MWISPLGFHADLCEIWPFELTLHYLGGAWRQITESLGRHLFIPESLSLSLSHKLLTQCTKIPRTAQKISVSGSCLTVFWEAGTVDLIFDCFLICRWFQFQLMFTEGSKKYHVLCFQNIYFSIVLEDFHSIMSMVIFYTWFPDDVIKRSHICFLWNYFTNLVLIFHTSFHKSTA